MERGAGCWTGWSGRHRTARLKGTLKSAGNETGRVKRSYSACYHFRMSLCFSAGNLQLFTRLGIVLGALSIPCIAPGIASAQSGTGSAVPNRAAIEEILQEPERAGGNREQVAISPDGKRLAWIEGARGGEEIRLPRSTISRKSERVTAAAKPDQHCREGEIAWEPDSKALAFFSDCANRESRSGSLFVAARRQRARRLTELQGIRAGAGVFAGWNERRVSLCGGRDAAGRSALAAMKPPSGVIGEDGVEIQRVAVARWMRPRLRLRTQVSPANLHVYEFDWSPDSKGLAYVAADPPGENNWWVAKLYTQALGGDAKAILAPAKVSGPLHGLQIAVPRWSPDGKAIAFIGGLMSDQGSTGGDVWIVSREGGAPQDLTPEQAHFAGVDRVGRRRAYFCERAGRGQLPTGAIPAARR